MRLWTLSPTYLDTKGLNAQWLEAYILKNKIKAGEKWMNYPGMKHLILSSNPVRDLDIYMTHLYSSALMRGYHYNDELFEFHEWIPPKIKVPREDIKKEFDLLMSRLKIRSPERYEQIKFTQDRYERNEQRPVIWVNHIFEEKE